MAAWSLIQKKTEPIDNNINQTLQSASVGRVEHSTKTEGTLTHEEVEDVIRASAEWGYSMAAIGFKSVPIPQIEWNADRPVIRFGQSSSSMKQHIERQETIEQLNAALAERDALTSFDRISLAMGISKEQVVNKRIARLRNQLRAIDPESIYLADN